jgi:hypothetical protein
MAGVIYGPILIGLICSELISTAVQHSVHPIPGKVRRGHGGGTAASLRAHALRAVRQFAWLEGGSVKVALSRPTSG